MSLWRSVALVSYILAFFVESRFLASSGFAFRSPGQEQNGTTIRLEDTASVAHDAFIVAASFEGPPVSKHRSLFFRDENESSKPISATQNSTAATIGAPTKKLKSLLSGTRFKMFLTFLGGLSIIFELIDELVEEFPAVNAFTRKLKLKHGVFFLTLSHMISAIDDICEKVQELEDVVQEEITEGQVEEYLDRGFLSEEDCARAYDKAATAIYKSNAQLNFWYPCREKDENGNLPERQSKYRGVKWSNKMQAWCVNEEFLTPP